MILKFKLQTYFLYIGTLMIWFAMLEFAVVACEAVIFRNSCK